MLQTQNFSLYLRASLNYQKERSLKNIFFYIRKCRINTLANHFLTHSLIRRLTVCSRSRDLGGIFQLTASQGGWPPIYSYTSRIFTFQLTASQGGWHSLPNCTNLPTAFQLTASQGGWLSHLRSVTRSGGFQLTASQGGWRKCCQFLSNLVTFQLTASQGGWQCIRTAYTGNLISTHSLTRRLTFLAGV